MRSWVNSPVTCVVASPGVHSQNSPTEAAAVPVLHFVPCHSRDTIMSHSD